jgi:aminoglycoside phosphotransferase (APT) family kinase protein
VHGVEPISGGAVGFTYAALLDQGADHRRIVLKVAPPGVAPVRNRDVLRQARLLRRLYPLGRCRVPEVLFEAGAESLEAPPFFAMAWIDGECVEPIMDDVDPLPEPPVVARRARAAARMLAALHATPAIAVAADEGDRLSLTDEVQRWAAALSTSPDVDPARVASGRAALLRHPPAPAVPALLHGDFRLGNMLCVDGDIRAVIDWEIWSVGDPRVDVAWFLAFSEPQRLAVARRAVPGMPSAAHLLREYEDERGSGIGDLSWFDALTRYKQAATTALIVKHNRRRPEPDAAVERLVEPMARMLDEALELAGPSTGPRTGFVSR